MSTTQNSRNWWCQIVRGTVCKDYINQSSPPETVCYADECFGETLIWESARNRQIFLTILRNIQFLSRQGLAFQENNNEENFEQLMKLSAKIDPRITSWMEKKISKVPSSWYPKWNHKINGLYNISPFKTLGIGCCPISRSRRVHLAFEVYHAGRLQWHFTCGFDFGHGLWSLFIAGFTVLKGLLVVPVGTMGYFSPSHKLFKAVGEPMGSVQSRELGTLAPPSEVYYAGKLQWHFTCGFDFRHSRWSPFVAGFAVLKGLRNIAKNINSSIFFSIMVDEVTNCSNKEHYLICFR